MCPQLCFVKLGGAKGSLALTPNRQFWRLLRVSALPTGRRETSCYLLQRCWLQLGQISWPFGCELCVRHRDVPLPKHSQEGFGAEASIPLAAYNVACRVAIAVSICVLRCPTLNELMRWHSTMRSGKRCTTTEQACMWIGAMKSMRLQIVWICQMIRNSRTSRR